MLPAERFPRRLLGDGGGSPCSRRCAEGLRQGTLAFSVVFTNGNAGVYTAPLVPCYPNCDSSTTQPILNVLDFSCFLNSFAAGTCP